jgi:hypothetical protein
VRTSNALIRPKIPTSSPTWKVADKRTLTASYGSAMITLASTLGLVLLLALVKVVLDRSDYQARDQDDWI